MLNNHIVNCEESIREIIPKLELLAKDAVLFVVDFNNILVGSLTDGDVRRGLIKDINLNDKVTSIMNINPHYILSNHIDLKKIKKFRENNIKIIPIVNDQRKIIDLLNFRIQKSIIPCDVVLMAGGKGTRLLPLTENTPKPLLKLGNKPVIETNIDRLISFGVKNFHISINYLGDQIQEYFGNGNKKGVSIEYVRELSPLGTIGSLSLINKFYNEHILLMNSDLLTSIDFEDFILDYIENNCQLSVVGIPYQVNIPYGVLETVNNKVKAVKEKPSYTFYSNGGIYLLNKKVINLIPKDKFYNATDLIEKLIELKHTVRTFPMMDYWMDIGNHSDFKKAQNDMKNINFD